MYEPVLKLLSSQPSLPSNQDSKIEILAVESVANASLHNFSEAQATIAQATQLCQASSENTCGDVIRAHGILAVQQGQIDAAKRYFGESLQFARVHRDPFLEETALLNLGLTSLRQNHFDEAIDWTEAASQAATNLGANGEAQAAIGNLGWAYYNLGDSEKSLDLSLQAEKLATQSGIAIDELYWITNVGYVYAGSGDLARAKVSYLKALDLATGIKSKEGIYNAQRALALVSLEGGELGEAGKYSDQAVLIARADHNRLNELYPLLVKGLVAVRTHDSAEAQRQLREVEQDPDGDAPLKWKAGHGLARLYEDEGRYDDADHEYRAALATFEQTRSSLHRDESMLPFSNNATKIYDDYIHFLVGRGKADEALRWADYSRARTLLEGLGVLSKGASDHAAPPALNPREISRRAKGALLFYWLGEKQSYLWAITPKKISLITLPPRADIESMVQRYRTALKGPQDVLQSGEDGRALYRTLIDPAKSLLPKDAKVFIIPDGSLNNLNFETLIVADPRPHSGSKMPKLQTPARCACWPRPSIARTPAAQMPAYQSTQAVCCSSATALPPARNIPNSREPASKWRTSPNTFPPRKSRFMTVRRRLQPHILQAIRKSFPISILSRTAQPAASARSTRPLCSPNHCRRPAQPKPTPSSCTPATSFRTARSTLYTPIW